MAKMCINSLGCILSHAEKEELIRRVSVPKKDYEIIAFDGAMLDALKEMFNDEPNLIEVLHDSAVGSRCTKQFYHEKPMMDHLGEYLKCDVRDRRGAKAYRAARVLLMKFMPKAQLHPEDIDEKGLEMFSNVKGAAGAIAKGSKGANATLCLDVAHRIKDAVNRGEEFKNIFVPTMCYHRSQLGNTVDDDGNYNPEFIMKDRMVEGVDGGTTLIEASYMKPVYDLLKSKWVCYAGGKDPQSLRDLIRSWRSLHYWIGTDFSKFDMHLPGWLLEDAFNIIKELYYNNFNDKTFEWVKYNFINTVMIGPDGNLYRKHHGIPSGSFCTQVIGTIVNLLMNLTGMAILTNQLKTHQMISELERNLVHPVYHELMMTAMGDDCLIFMRKEFDGKYVEHLAEAITKVFGVMVNAEKTEYGKSCDYPSFLKREWREGGEYQNPKKLFINVVHPEHTRTYDNYSPWHILYGLWLTYKYSFPAKFSALYFIEKMQKHPNGIEALRDMPLQELPGVFRGLGESPTRMLYDWAKHHCNLA